MEIHEFHRLDETEQLKIILDHGLAIGEMDDTECRSFLYSIDSFYVAIRYSLSTDDILEILAFKRINPSDRRMWKRLRIPTGTNTRLKEGHGGHLI